MPRPRAPTAPRPVPVCRRRELAGGRLLAIEVDPHRLDGVAHQFESEVGLAMRLLHQHVLAVVDFDRERLGIELRRRTSRIFRATAFSLVPLAIGTATSKAATPSGEKAKTISPSDFAPSLTWMRYLFDAAQAGRAASAQTVSRMHRETNRCGLGHAGILSFASQERWTPIRVGRTGRVAEPRAESYRRSLLAGRAGGCPRGQREAGGPGEWIRRAGAALSGSPGYRRAAGEYNSSLF